MPINCNRRARGRIYSALANTALLMFAVTSGMAAERPHIVFSRLAPDHSGLFIADADGAHERPLLPATGLDYNASFSYDGEWIVFTSERGGSADIYRMHADGSGIERLTDVIGRAHEPRGTPRRRLSGTAV